MKRELIIIDDEPKVLTRYSQKLQHGGAAASFEIQCASRDALLDGVQLLEERCQNARRGRIGTSAKTIFDQAAVLVIDFDLIKFKGFLTGETIAYLARNYSTCGYIIGLNQYGNNSFDLELSGRIESFADLNIGGGHLDASGLWTHSFKGYRPWHWPVIPDAVDTFERRVKDILRRLDSPILEYLGFPENEIPLLPKSMLSFLSDGRKPEKATFRDFVTHSQYGLRSKDRAWSDVGVARCASARIAKWLEFVVLPRQDILVDAPHLVSRYPSLLKGSKTTVQSWNRLASLDRRAVQRALNGRSLSKAEFGAAGWLNRPAWWWHAVSVTKEIAEVKSPWENKPSPWVFCEDSSRFTKKSEARPFTSSLDTPYASRYVEYRPDIDYHPSGRFAL